MLTHDEWLALALSLRVACAAVLVSAIPAIAIGWVLARIDFRGKLLLHTLVHLPLVLPPVVTGYLLLIVFGKNGPIGSVLDGLGLALSFTWQGAALASAVVGFPLFVRAIRLTFESNGQSLEEASLTLGHGPISTFLRITLPLGLPGIATGAVLAFARSLGEFGATIVFVGNIAGVTRTLPLAIFSALQTPEGDRGAVRLVIVCILLSALALAASETWQRRHKARYRRVEVG